MMRTPDGHGRLELTKFRSPKLVAIEPAIVPLCYMRGPAGVIVALAEELS